MSTTVELREDQETALRGRWRRGARRKADLDAVIREAIDRFLRELPEPEDESAAPKCDLP